MPRFRPALLAIALFSALPVRAESLAFPVSKTAGTHDAACGAGSGATVIAGGGLGCRFQIAPSRAQFLEEVAIAGITIQNGNVVDIAQTWVGGEINAGGFRGFDENRHMTLDSI